MIKVQQIDKFNQISTTSYILQQNLKQYNCPNDKIHDSALTLMDTNYKLFIVSIVYQMWRGYRIIDCLICIKET